MDMSQLPTFWPNLRFIASFDMFVYPDKTPIVCLEVHGIFQKRSSNRRNRKESTSGALIKYVE